MTPTICAVCGAENSITTEVKDEEFQYGAGDSAVMLTARSVSFHTCSKCFMTYTDHVAEEQRDRAVEHHQRDATMRVYLSQFKPCPFCGYELKNNLDDSVYPSGRWWREDGPRGVGFRHYVGHRERQPGDHPVYSVNCAECSGGCGAELTADSMEEALEKWNRRTGA